MDTETIFRELDAEIKAEAKQEKPRSQWRSVRVTRPGNGFNSFTGSWGR